MSWRAGRAMDDAAARRRSGVWLAGLLVLLVVAGLARGASGSSAASECGDRLRRIEETESAPPRRQAAALDRLRDTCSEKLAWTDPLLVRIAERSVAVRRPLEDEEPAALCKALRDLGFSDHYLGKLDAAHRLYREAVATARRWRGRGTSDEDLAAALDSLTSTLL